MIRNHRCIQSTFQKLISLWIPVVPGCSENTIDSDQIVLGQGKPNHPNCKSGVPHTFLNPHCEDISGTSG